MVSIIIPVYNSVQFLERCVNCVANQTYKEWELILIDDGSTDGSEILCDEYAKEEARIKVYHQLNKGASLARKKGIELARGEYLTFVDSDDIVEDDYLERLVESLQKFHVKIAACDQVKHIEGEDVQIDKTGMFRLLEENELHERFFKYQFWGLGGKLYHRSVFDNVYFPQCTINEDYVVMTQLFHRYKQMAYVPIGLYHYMTHGGSLSHQKLSMRMFDEYYNKLWVRDFYKKENPKYLLQSEAQLTETCIKLIRCIKKDDEKKQYQKELRMMQSYLRGSLFSILGSRYLLLGLKCMALRYCFF